MSAMMRAAVLPALQHRATSIFRVVTPSCVASVFAQVLHTAHPPSLRGAGSGRGHYQRDPRHGVWIVCCSTALSPLSPSLCCPTLADSCPVPLRAPSHTERVLDRQQLLDLPLPAAHFDRRLPRHHGPRRWAHRLDTQRIHRLQSLRGWLAGGAISPVHATHTHSSALPGIAALHCVRVIDDRGRGTAGRQN